MDPFTTSWPQHPSAIHGPMFITSKSCASVSGMSEMCHAPPMHRSRGHPPLRDKPGRNDGVAPRVKRVFGWGEVAGIWLQNNTMVFVESFLFGHDLGFVEG